MAGQARPQRNVAGLSPAGSAALAQAMARGVPKQSQAEIARNFAASRAKAVAAGRIAATPTIPAPRSAAPTAARTAGS